MHTRRAPRDHATHRKRCVHAHLFFSSFSSYHNITFYFWVCTLCVPPRSSPSHSETPTCSNATTRFMPGFIFLVISCISRVFCFFCEAVIQQYASHVKRLTRRPPRIPHPPRAPFSTQQAMRDQPFTRWRRLARNIEIRSRVDVIARSDVFGFCFSFGGVIVSKRHKC